MLQGLIPTHLTICTFLLFLIECLWSLGSNNLCRKGSEVPELDWCEPGEEAAMEVLMGSKAGFLTKRFKNYATDRNNPLKPKGLSGLSPYLHFGQISAQRCAIEARNARKLSPQVSTPRAF